MRFKYKGVKVTKYIKIIYEDWVKDVKVNGITFMSKIVEALCPFGNLNTLWTDSRSYTDNFEMFVQDVFECGFVYLSKSEAIPVFCIKKFLVYEDNKPKPQNKSQDKSNLQNKRRSGKKRFNKDLLKDETKNRNVQKALIIVKANQERSKVKDTKLFEKNK